MPPGASARSCRWSPTSRATSTAWRAPGAATPTRCGRVARPFVRQLYAASRFRAPASLPLPTLALGTRGDRFVDPRCTERLAAHFGLPVRWHDTAGHDLPADAPEWVIEQVSAWVAAG
jgi:hypothetical protein